MMTGHMYYWGFCNVELILVFGVGAVFLGVCLLSESSRKNREQRREISVELYRLASTRDGILTVSDVVSTLGLSPAKAEKELDTLIDGQRVSIEEREQEAERNINSLFQHRAHIQPQKSPRNSQCGKIETENSIAKPMILAR